MGILATTFGFLAIICGLNYVAAAKDNSCGLLMFTTEGCCDIDIPIAIPKEAMTACMPGFSDLFKGSSVKGGGLGSKLSGMLGMKPKAAGASGLFSGVLGRMRGSGGGGGGGGGLGIPEGGPVCAMECVLRNQSLLTPDGEADQKLIEEKLLSAANDEWKPIISAAVANCSAELTTVDQSKIAVSKSNGKVCKPSSMLFSACMRRFIMLSCPKYNTDDATCAGKISGLKSCNPFVVSSQFSILSKLREMFSKKTRH